MQLPWTHVDVMEWKSVLIGELVHEYLIADLLEITFHVKIEQYGYSEADIVCLLDAEGYDRSLWPSHDNIVRSLFDNRIHC